MTCSGSRTHVQWEAGSPATFTYPVTSRMTTYTHTHTHTHARTRTHTHARTHTHTHAHTRTRTHTRARAHTHAHTRAHAHTHTHARTHTHTHTQPESQTLHPQMCLLPGSYAQRPTSRGIITQPHRIKVGQFKTALIYHHPHRLPPRNITTGSHVVLVTYSGAMP